MDDTIPDAQYGLRNSMNSSLTICIPTCGRPDKLRDCIEGIRSSSGTAHPIIILDSAPSHDLQSGYRNSEDITVITMNAVVGPSKARKMLADRVETPYLLFLDDDLIPLPNSIDILHRRIEANPDEIFGGILREGDGFREAGQIFIKGYGTNNQAVIHKKFLTVEDCYNFDIREARVDGCMSSFVVSKATLEQVSFDPAYRFYYELFDFFLQCRAKGVPVNVLMDAQFRHQPGDYACATNRDLSRKHDTDHFRSKWGLQAKGALGGGDIQPEQRIRKQPGFLTRLLRNH